MVRLTLHLGQLLYWITGRVIVLHAEADEAAPGLRQNVLGDRVLNHIDLNLLSRGSSLDWPQPITGSTSVNESAARPETSTVCLATGIPLLVVEGAQEVD